MGKYTSDRSAFDDALPESPSQDPECPPAGESCPGTVYPDIADRAEWSSVITYYDRQHIVTDAAQVGYEIVLCAPED